MFLFHSIKNHYKNVAMQLRLTDDVKNIHYDGNTVLILVGNMTQASIRAINYAKSIGQTVVAMHVSTLETREKDLEVEEEFKKMADAYKMEVEKIKELLGDRELEQMKKDMAVQKAVTLVADEAKEA